MFYPTEILPPLLQALGQLLPMTHALVILRGSIFLGLGINDMLPPVRRARRDELLLLRPRPVRLRDRDPLRADRRQPGPVLRPGADAPRWRTSTARRRPSASARGPIVDPTPRPQLWAGLVRGGLDWDRMWDLGHRHDVLPLLAETLPPAAAAAGGAVPAENGSSGPPGAGT